MPTFQIFRNNQKINEFVGADEMMLRNSIQSAVSAAEQEAAQQPRQPQQPQQPRPQQPRPQQSPPQQPPPPQPAPPQSPQPQSSGSKKHDSNSALTFQSLHDFFVRVDPSLAVKQIVDMYLHDNSQDIPRFLKFLQRQYGQVPEMQTQQPSQSHSQQPQTQQQQEQPEEVPRHHLLLLLRLPHHQEVQEVQETPPLMQTLLCL